MRILVAHHHRRLVGGIETYLAAVLPRLAGQGHALFFAHEGAPATGQTPIPLPRDVEVGSLENGTGEILRRISAWRPDVAFVHALHAPKLQRAIVTEYPTA